MSSQAGAAPAEWPAPRHPYHVVGEEGIPSPTLFTTCLLTKGEEGGNRSDLCGWLVSPKDYRTLRQAAEACKGLSFPSLGPRKGRQEEGPQQQACNTGLARQGGPWGCSYQPEPRLQEGRKGNSDPERDKERTGLAQWAPTRLRSPQSDCVPTWTLFCSNSPCKYLLLFISMVCRVPFEALRYSVQIYVPWVRAATFPLVQSSGMAPEGTYHRLVLAPDRHLRSPVLGEAVLSLGIDWWKDRFAVNLQPSPQGLPDLLCVCKEITKLPDGAPGSQPDQEPRRAAH